MEGLGEGLGGFGEIFGLEFFGISKKNTLFKLTLELGRGWEGFGRALGRVLGGFGRVLGEVWERFGRGAVYRYPLLANLIF